MLKKVENIVEKGEITLFEQFLICCNVSKSHLLQRHQKVSIGVKGLITFSHQIKCKK